MDRSAQGLPRLIPTGTCSRGCGQTASIGSFFAWGHESLAETALLATQYGGSVPQVLRRHGYGPGRSVIDDAVDIGAATRCLGFRYAGNAGSARNHQRKAGR